jgi:hypothetical protein
MKWTLEENLYLDEGARENIVKLTLRNVQVSQARFSFREAAKREVF